MAVQLTCSKPFTFCLDVCHAVWLLVRGLYGAIVNAILPALSPNAVLLWLT